MDRGSALDVLERHPEVRLAFVFGSALEGRQTETSDLDLGVVLEAGADPRVYDRLHAELERAVERDVDLVDLRNAPPLLAHQVVSRGALLLSRNEDERAAFAARVVARYLDTAHLRKVQHEYLRERAEARHAASR